MLLCASGLRPSEAAGNSPLLRLAHEAGCAGIFIAEGSVLEPAMTLATEALRAGLDVHALFAPLPERRLGPGRRLPRMSAVEADERGAAVAMAARVVALAGSIGGRVVALGFGPVALTARLPVLARFFRRRGLAHQNTDGYADADGDGDGDAVLAAAIGERRAIVEPALDACRFALDPLLREAERWGVRLALDLAATPWGIPSPREGLELLKQCEGAPLGVVFDPARLAAMRRLDLAISPPRLAALKAAAALWLDNEAVGMDPGFLPGLGERDDDLADRTGAEAKAPVALVGHPDSTDEEVARAAARAREGDGRGAARALASAPEH